MAAAAAAAAADESDVDGMEWQHSTPLAWLGLPWLTHSSKQPCTGGGGGSVVIDEIRWPRGLAPPPPSPPV